MPDAPSARREPLGGEGALQFQERGERVVRLGMAAGELQHVVERHPLDQPRQSLGLVPGQSTMILTVASGMAASSAAGGAARTTNWPIQQVARPASG